MDAEALSEAVHISAIQHGVITRPQVLAVGLTRHALAHLVTSGRWQRVLPRVYATSVGELGPWTWASAASRHLGEHGVVARTSALAAFGVLPWPPRTQVLVRSRRDAVHPQLEVHRTRSLPPQDLAAIRGVRTSSPLRSLLDLARELDEIALADLTALLMRRRLVTASALARRLHTMPREPYTAALREMVAVPGRADSGPELVLARALRRAGFEVELNGVLRLPDGRVRRGDIVLHGHRIVIQVESLAFHSGGRGEADMARDADWMAAGYLTIRVPPKRIRSDLDRVLREVTAATRGRSGRSGAA